MVDTSVRAERLSASVWSTAVSLDASSWAGGIRLTAGMEMTSFWTVFKSIRIQGSYVGNRQDAIEALELATGGKIKVHYELKKLKELKE